MRQHFINHEIVAEHFQSSFQTLSKSNNNFNDDDDNNNNNNKNNNNNNSNDDVNSNNNNNDNNNNNNNNINNNNNNNNKNNNITETTKYRVGVQWGIVCLIVERTLQLRVAVFLEMVSR